MAKKRAKTYSREFREEVLRLAANSEKSDTDIKRDLGLSPHLISQWRKRYSSPQGKTANQLKPSTLSEAEAEIHRLQRELEKVKQERDILKKR